MTETYTQFIKRANKHGKVIAEEGSFLVTTSPEDKTVTIVFAIPDPQLLPDGTPIDEVLQDLKEERALNALHSKAFSTIKRIMIDTGYTMKERREKVCAICNNPRMASI